MRGLSPLLQEVHDNLRERTKANKTKVARRQPRGLGVSHAVWGGPSSTDAEEPRVPNACQPTSESTHPLKDSYGVAKDASGARIDVW